MNPNLVTITFNGRVYDVQPSVKSDIIALLRPYRNASRPVEDAADLHIAAPKVHDAPKPDAGEGPKMKTDKEESAGNRPEGDYPGRTINMSGAALGRPAPESVAPAERPTVSDNQEDTATDPVEHAPDPGADEPTGT